MSFDPMTKAINVEGLCKCYRRYDKPIDRLKQFLRPQKRYYTEFNALSNVYLTVNKGESLGIIGKNGSGKSTLLQLICGTLTPTNGLVKTDGKIAALLELGSGFNPEFTGIENIYLNASILGLSKKEIDNRLDSILSFAEIGDFIHQPLKSYSSGMIVRLAFSVITNVNADILIIDEALAVGDIFFTQKCSRFLRSFRERGSLLFVSHDMESVKSLCDRAVLLDKGKIQMIGDTKDVADAYFAQAYGNSLKQAIASKESEQEKTSSATSKQEEKVSPIRPRARVHPWFDYRQELYGNKVIGSKGDLSSFDEAIQHSERFGDNSRVEIVHVGILDPVSGDSQTSFHGGYPYILNITCNCHQSIEQPDVGFCLNDKLGQVLFGDNTNSLQPRATWEEGRTYEIQFEFDMPVLKTGEYTISVAIQEHKKVPPIILNWIHDALLLYTHQSSTAIGLSGVAMRRITLGTAETQATAEASKDSKEQACISLTANDIRRQRNEEFRVAMTCSCRDSDAISKVEDAGKIIHSEVNTESLQIMHNGLKVVAGGYYGDWMSRIIENLHGHHEPQEEVLFHAILQRLDRQSATMIELGSFWSYYSLWFLKQNPDQNRAFCLEADPEHLAIGQRNAELNQLSPKFIHGFAGEKESVRPIPFTTEKSGTLLLDCFSVDQLKRKHQIDFIDILHLDTQGAELSVLKGAAEAIRNRQIRFLVVSTHSYEICGDPLIHQRCLAWLQEHGAHIICEHDVHESFSGDGLIVASLNDEDREWVEHISRNRYANSLFPNPAYYVPMRPQESPII